MNLGIEYLARTGLLKEFFTSPCSLFLERSPRSKKKLKGTKLVVTISNGNDYYIVKHWYVSLFKDYEALPAMEEYYVEDVFSSPNVIVPDYRLFKYKNKYPSRQNSWRTPMPEDVFKTYHDEYFNSKQHRTACEKWLLETFLKVHIPELFKFGDRLTTYFGTKIPTDMITKKQKHELLNNFPKKNKYWEMWRRYMLDFDGTPGELSFINSFPTITSSFSSSSSS